MKNGSNLAFSRGRDECGRGLFVDSRWGGSHGIGRYSEEVLSRLHLPWSPLPRSHPLLSVRDLLLPQRLPLQTLVYSPGFNVFPTNATIIPTLHDLIPLTFQSNASFAHNYYFNRILKPAVLKAGLVFTVSEVSKKLLLDWLGGTGAVRVVNTGVGLSLGRSSAIFSPKDHLLFVGNSKPHKNLEVLLHALALNKKLRLRAVVPEKDRLPLEARSYELGIWNQISILTGLSDSDLVREYEMAAALAFPSLEEGFGLPPLEAAAIGTPVIHWRGCESVSEILSGHGVQINDAKDPEQWAFAMEQARDPQRLDKQFSDHLALKYSWDVVAQKISTALELVL